MSVNKIFLIALVVLIDFLIFFLVDSTECNTALYLIIAALFVQVFLLIECLSLGNFDEFRFFNLKKYEKVIILFFSFLLLINGNLGVDKAGKITNCPITWLDYIG